MKYNLPMHNINTLTAKCNTGGANALLFVPLMEHVAVMF